MANNNKDTLNTAPEEMHIPVAYERPHHAHMGPILGVLVIVLVIILGGLYLWGSMLHEESQVQEERVIINNEPETPRAKVDTQILETLSPSDELSAIEADLESTNLGSLDADMVTIDAELDAAFIE